MTRSVAKRVPVFYVFFVTGSNICTFTRSSFVQGLIHRQMGSSYTFACTTGTTCDATVPTGRSTNSIIPSTMLFRAGSLATVLPAR